MRISQLMQVAEHQQTMIGVSPLQLVQGSPFREIGIPKLAEVLAVVVNLEVDILGTHITGQVFE